MKSGPTVEQNHHCKEFRDKAIHVTKKQLLRWSSLPAKRGSRNDRRSNAGFTLLEIIVVLLILGIVASFAAVSLSNRGHARALGNTAHRLTQVINVAAQQASLQPAVLGLYINQRGYQFYHFYLQGEHEGKWLPIKDDAVYAWHDFPANAHVVLMISKKVMALDAVNQPNRVPQILISPSGDITAFELGIGPTSGKLLYKVTTLSNGQITLTSSLRTK